jgi:hypothetical protein
MPVLENANHEAFAQAVSDGMSGWAAYMAHVSKDGKCTKGTAEVAASRLLADGTKVAERVAELRRMANELAEQELRFGKLDLMKYLVETLQTPIGNIDEQHRQCQEYHVDSVEMGGKRGKLKRGQAPEGNEEETPASVILKQKYKMPGKIEAAKLLATLCGWNAPEKHDVTLTGPRAVLAAVLNRKQHPPA